MRSGTALVQHGANDFTAESGDLIIGNPSSTPAVAPETTRRDSEFRLKSPGQRSIDSGIAFHHDASSVDDVFRDVTETYPEDSFCLLNVRLLRERASDLKRFFLPNNQFAAVAYAVKANAKRKILDVLASEGIEHFDCASPREIHSVQEVSPDAEIFFNHPIKSVSAIRDAAQRGVKHYTVQSQREIEKIMDEVGEEPFGMQPEIAVRLRTLNDKAAINLSTKFGASERDVRAMIAGIRQRYKAFPGISVHTGSQNTDAKVYGEAIQKISAIARELGGVNSMNLGGGLPANYGPKDSFRIREYLRIINDAVQAYAKDVIRGPNPKIILEVGRAMVAESIDLFIPVLAVEKRDGGKCIYVNDGVYTSFSDFAVHRWPYHFEWRGKGDRKLSKNLAPVEMFGRTCDSGDSLGQVMVPEDLDEGDYLWMKSAGAYMDSQGGLFNGFDLPKYVTYNS